MFASGDAYPEGLPDVSEFARRAAVNYRTETLQYAPRPGLPELREWVAQYLAGEGIRVDADNILICNGAKQGIELAGKLFLDPGDAIVVTRPTYQSALGVFRGWEASFVEVGMDADGMIVDELAATLAGARAPRTAGAQAAVRRPGVPQPHRRDAESRPSRRPRGARPSLPHADPRGRSVPAHPVRGRAGAADPGLGSRRQRDRARHVREARRARAPPRVGRREPRGRGAHGCDESGWRDVPVHAADADRVLPRRTVRPRHPAIGSRPTGRTAT